MKYRSVLLDWAGTITIPLTEMMLAAADRLSLSPNDMARLLGGMRDYLGENDTLIHRAEKGLITDSELMEHMDSISPGTGRFFDPAEPTFYYARDRPEMLAFIDDVRSAGLRAVIASNNLASASPVLSARYLETGLVDAIVNSADIGHRKPESEFFRSALVEARCEASEAVLLDDMGTNIAAATEYGIRSVLVSSSPTEALTEARGLLGL